MVTCGTKFFTVFLILLSIVFQISSFPDYRFFIEEGYAPFWPQPSDRQLKMIDRAEGLIVLQDFIKRRFIKKLYKMWEKCLKPCSQGASYVLS